MSTAFFLARRLSFASSGKKSNPAVKVATIAVALSVAVMIASIAVVLGFKQEISRKVLGFNPHLVVTTNPNFHPADPLVSFTPTLENLLHSEPYVSDVALSAAAPGMIKTQSDFQGLYFKSLSGIPFNDFIKGQLIDGKMPNSPADSASIVVSKHTADKLQLKVGQKVDAYFFSDDVKARRLTIAGIFDSHFEAYDNLYAYTPGSVITDVGNLSDTQGTSISIYVDDFDKVEDYRSRLEDRLAQAFESGEVYKYYSVESAESSGAAFFSWLSLLDMNVVIVLILMASVAFVTLISGMLIIIVDKTRFIAVMRAMGADTNLLGRTFVILTLRIALVGMLFGNFIMFTLLLLQYYTHFIPLDPESYYIDYVPVKLDWLAFLWLNIAIFVLAWIVLILPSRFVGSISVVKALQKD